jgi:hypothetical protein
LPPLKIEFDRYLSTARHQPVKAEPLRCAGSSYGGFSQVQ